MRNGLYIPLRLFKEFGPEDSQLPQDFKTIIVYADILRRAAKAKTEDFVYDYNEVAERYCIGNISVRRAVNKLIKSGRIARDIRPAPNKDGLMVLTTHIALMEGGVTNVER